MATKKAPATTAPATRSPARKAPENTAARIAGVARPSANRRVSSDRTATFTAPTLSAATGKKVAERLQQRLVGMTDLAMTLKHIHWNVVGPNFIAVHEMLDPQYQAASLMVDEIAERISTLGGSPNALPGTLVTTRTWDDYDLDRADGIVHLGALDLVYEGTIADHREAIDDIGETDIISQDLLISQTRQLEQFQWFVRAHLADAAGGMANAGATTEMEAAEAVAAKTSTRRR